METSLPEYEEDKVTVFPVPTFLLSKAPVAETTKLSPLTNPVYTAEVTSVVAFVLPSYVF